MPEELFNIPLVPWVRITIENMISSGKDDSKTWGIFWYEVYTELGGSSKSSGRKGCPKLAAFGLWRLGRIVNSGAPYQNLSIEEVRKIFGKNAVYALLALDAINMGWESKGTSTLWNQVRSLYQQKLLESPAQSEQGAIKVASILFNEGQIISETL